MTRTRSKNSATLVVVLLFLLFAISGTVFVFSNDWSSGNGESNNTGIFANEDAPNGKSKANSSTSKSDKGPGATKTDEGADTTENNPEGQPGVEPDKTDTTPDNTGTKPDEASHVTDGTEEDPVENAATLIVNTRTESHHALSRVNVEIELIPETPSSAPDVKVGHTNASGRVTFENLKPDTLYRVTAKNISKDFMVSRRHLFKLPESVAEITTKPNGRHEVELVLSDGPWVRGRVMTDTGLPCAFAKLAIVKTTFRSKHDGKVNQRTIVSSATMKADSKGYFSFYHEVADEIGIFASWEDADSNSYDTNHYFEIHKPKIYELGVITLTKQFAINATVLLDEKPAANKRLYFRAWRGEDWFIHFNTTTTREGKFRLTNVEEDVLRAQDTTLAVGVRMQAGEYQYFDISDEVKAGNPFELHISTKDFATLRIDLEEKTMESTTVYCLYENKWINHSSMAEFSISLTKKTRIEKLTPGICDVIVVQGNKRSEVQRVELRAGAELTLRPKLSEGAIIRLTRDKFDSEPLNATITTASGGAAVLDNPIISLNITGTDKDGNTVALDYWLVTPGTQFAIAVSKATIVNQEENPIKHINVGPFASGDDVTVNIDE